MRPLGKRQIDLLAMMTSVGRALVVPNEVSKALCKRGLMEVSGRDIDGFVVVTPNGLRALADAMDAGKISHIPDWEKLKKRGVKAA